MAKNLATPAGFMTATECANLLGMSVYTFREYVKAGEIPVALRTRVGMRFVWEDVLAAFKKFEAKK